MRLNSKKQTENNYKTSHCAGLFAPEILAPAGSMEGLVGAINAGADAVYLGGELFSARAFAQNFTIDEIIKGIEYAHIHNAKVYITINTLLKNKEIIKLCDYVKPIYLAGIDGVIVQDFGVMEVLHNTFPDLPLHASTQMAVSSAYSAKALIDKYDVKRVVLARECALSEIIPIVNSGIETECFIHGSMCYSVSGQCLFSSLVGGRSGNRGRCAQSCRLPYKINDSKDAEYLLSLKDMCTLEYLPEIIEAKISSLKIEGRMKSPAYAAGVTAMYRKYVDRYFDNPSGYSVDKEDLIMLKSLYIRSEIQRGYFDKYRAKSMVTINNPSYSKTDDELIDLLMDKYCNSYDKIIIDAYLSAVTGEEISLTLSIPSMDKTFTALGDEVIVANNRPLTMQDAKKGIGKLGDTLFTIDQFDGYISEDAFVTVASLKNLRRAAIKGLMDILIMDKRSEDSINDYYAIYVNDESDKKTDSLTNNEFICFCNTLSQLKICLLDKNVKEIAITCSLARNPLAIELIKSSDKRIFIRLPEFIRLEMFDDIKDLLLQLMGNLSINGFYVNQLDSYYFVKEIVDSSDFDYEIRGDIHFYQNNNMSIISFADQINSYTVSAELNKDELAHMNNTNGEMMIYGYLPLMVTANCVRLSKGICHKYDTKSMEDTYLTDRKNQIERVITHCDEKVCYNIIYNNLPTSLHKNMDIVGKLGFKRLQFRFTFENDFEVRNVLDVFCEDKGEVSYRDTNGHFVRGVD